MLSPRKFAALSTLVALAFTGLALPTASAATYDTDGDKIPDAWEINGYDADGDGVIDINFPALGADPHYKDLFVEMDYMPGTNSDPRPECPDDPQKFQAQSSAPGISPYEQQEPEIEKTR